MKEKTFFKTLLVVLFVTGTIIGVSASYVFADSSEGMNNQCEQLEKDIQEELPYGENTRCYSPGHITIEESEVDEVDLECTCRIVYQEEVEIYPIYSPSHMGDEEVENLEQLE